MCTVRWTPQRPVNGSWIEILLVAYCSRGITLALFLNYCWLISYQSITHRLSIGLGPKALRISLSSGLPRLGVPLTDQGNNTLGCYGLVGCALNVHAFGYSLLVAILQVDRTLQENHLQVLQKTSSDVAVRCNALRSRSCSYVHLRGLAYLLHDQSGFSCFGVTIQDYRVRNTDWVVDSYRQGDIQEPLVVGFDHQMIEEYFSVVFLTFGSM